MPRFYLYAEPKAQMRPAWPLSRILSWLFLTIALAVWSGVVIWAI